MDKPSVAAPNNATLSSQYDKAHKESQEDFISSKQDYN
jgi:hypothetical protein